MKKLYIFLIALVSLISFWVVPVFSYDNIENVKEVSPKKEKKIVRKNKPSVHKLKKNTNGTQETRLHLLNGTWFVDGKKSLALIPPKERRKAPSEESLSQTMVVIDVEKQLMTTHQGSGKSITVPMVDVTGKGNKFTATINKREGIELTLLTRGRLKISGSGSAKKMGLVLSRQKAIISSVHK